MNVDNEYMKIIIPIVVLFISLQGSWRYLFKYAKTNNYYKRKKG